MKKFAGYIIILDMRTKNHNHMMYGSWHMECDRQNFLSLWTVFCPLGGYPMNPENQNFEKMKKTLEDIIILQMFTINDSHMIYEMECNRQDFCHLDRFLHFYPLTTRYIKILKNWKKPLVILSFYTSKPKIMIICYAVP